MNNIDSKGNVQLKLYELTKDGNYIDIDSYSEKNGVPSIDTFSLDQIKQIANETYGLSQNMKYLKQLKSLSKLTPTVPKQTDLIRKKIENDIRNGITIGKNPEKNINPDVKHSQNLSDDIPI